MVRECWNCGNNKQGFCHRYDGSNHGPIIEGFVCDFYREKRSGAFRRKMAKMKLYDTLDEIRDEIANLVDDDPEEDYQFGYNYGLMKAAQIIDKHRTEKH